MSQRAPSKAVTVLLKVTRPMTLPSLMKKKRQIPGSKLQRSSTVQAQPSRSLRLPPRLWELELGASLEFGIWSLDVSCHFRLIHHTNDHPAHRAFRILNRITRRRAIGRNHHSLVHACTVGIDGDLRCAFGLAT